MVRFLTKDEAGTGCLGEELSPTEISAMLRQEIETAGGGLPLRFVTQGPEDTEVVGEALGKLLPGGSVLAYTGDLGAGKTAFTRGLARGLGITERVTSPTFNIVNEYEGGRLPLFHFDLYRLGSAEELFDIGWEDYLARNGVCAVEWSENAQDALEDPIYVELSRGDSDTQRVITISQGRGFQ
jgi:tRNA threonylcarbamoyladenosine biosynthesis protein TsaE